MISNLRYAFRQLRKSPVFAVVAIATATLGIGANTAIFSVINAVLLRPLPYADPGRLVTILHNGDNPVAPANFLDWQKQSDVFESMGAAQAWTPNLSGTDQAESIIGMEVSHEVLPMLGVRPLLGRWFLPEEDEPGKDRVVVLSHRLWVRRFGGSPDIVGQAITLHGEKHTVVGVMPGGFRFAPFWDTQAEIWRPLALGDRKTHRTDNSLRVFARQKPGVTLAEAQAQMATITQRLEQQYPGTNRNVTVQLLKDKAVGQVRPALVVLMAAVAFVLLIACANVAHMLMARGAARQREIAVRAALGARRAQIVSQFLTESVLLSLIGGVGGLVLAFWGVRVLRNLAPAILQRFGPIEVEWPVMAFTAAVSLLTGVIFGIAPAWQAGHVDVQDELRGAGRGGGENRHHQRLRNVLVGSEFALALLLLTGAGLMIRTLYALQSIDPGFNPHHVLSAVVSVAGSQEAEPGRRAAFYETLLQRVKALPGVESVSAINHVPLAGDQWGLPFTIERRPAPKPGEAPSAVYRVVLPGYFQTMNITLLRGRDISESDNLNAPGVVVINEQFAKRHWPGEDPLGKRITLDDPAKNPQWLTVIGVAADAKQDTWTGTPAPEMYLPLLQSKEYLEAPSGHFEYITLVTRTRKNPAAMTSEIKNTIASIDRNVVMTEITTLDEAVEDANAQSRLELWLFAAFAGTALALAALGIYGVMSYSVSRRTHEMGVRMALGAERGDVVRLVLRQAMVLVAAGTACGILAAFALSRFMANQLYGVKPNDPLTYASVVAVVIAVALLASYFPARRATRVDPMQALRYE
ncbi:MAG TPA: ABC transporter permease [Candidatus Eisenbacteria bacterium]|nr:ABC transporter permease [Candidatus Eisenbacteria bacterium]